MAVFEGVEIQGHRGCRGHMPENTLPAFEKAIQLNVPVLEMDVCISRDLEVVVSHEPWFNPELTEHPIALKGPLENNLYRLPYEAIAKVDVGLHPHPRFPEQIKVPAWKPLLVEVLHLALTRKPNIRFNIEIKSRPEGDNRYHPEVNDFCQLVWEVLDSFEAMPQCTIQSFDQRALRWFKKAGYPGPLSLLNENPIDLETQLQQLGFHPEIYSPDFSLINAALVKECSHKKIEVVPWTVNTLEEAERLYALGLRTWITDYPEKFL